MRGRPCVDRPGLALWTGAIFIEFVWGDSSPVGANGVSSVVAMCHIVEEHGDQCPLKRWHRNICLSGALVIDEAIDKLISGHIEGMYVITTCFHKRHLERRGVIFSENIIHDVVKGSLGCSSSGRSGHVAVSIRSEGNYVIFRRREQVDKPVDPSKL